MSISLEKMKEAGETLFLAEKYMDELGKEFENLRMEKITEKQVMDYIEILLPLGDAPTPHQRKNITRLQEDLKRRYFDAPDLKDLGNNAYRFINAVSDFAIGMMLAAARNIAKAHYAIQNGEWRKTFVNSDCIPEMHDKTIGLVGFGYIGKLVAKKLSGFDVNIVVYDPYTDASVNIH